MKSILPGNSSKSCFDMPNSVYWAGAYAQFSIIFCVKRLLTKLVIEAESYLQYFQKTTVSHDLKIFFISILSKSCFHVPKFIYWAGAYARFSILFCVNVIHLQNWLLRQNVIFNIFKKLP